MAPNREAATNHIANKHTTNQRRPWKPLRQAYFYKTQLDNGKTIEQLIEEYPEQDISQFIRMLEMQKAAKATPIEDKSLREKVDDERDFAASTYARMYEHPVVKKFLGIDFDKQGRLKGKVDVEEFKKGNQKILEDIASGKITSRTSNSKEDVSKLLEKFPKKNTPDLSKKSKFTTDDLATRAGSAGSTSKSVPSEQTGTTTRTSTTKSSPKILFRKKEVPFDISSSPLKAMYEELRTIDTLRFPNATHDLMRSFLECSLCVYLKEVNQYENVKARKKGQPTLSEMLAFVYSDDGNIITDENVRQVAKQVSSNDSNQYSLERMNMINHNENWVSTTNDVKVAWSRLESLIKFLLNPHTHGS